MDESPLPRMTGAVAEHAAWEGILDAAIDARDKEREREARVALARLAVARGTDLEAAIEHGRRALGLRDDAPLRLEVAGWMAGLGDAIGAAGTLLAASDADERTRARTALRRAMLLARARRAEEAARLLDGASADDPTDPIASEMLGTLAAWAPTAVPRERAAQAYLVAAGRRDAQGDPAAALEDRLRAFEACPTSPEAAAELGRSLEQKGRGAAADEVLRDHAFALLVAGDDAGACSVHLDRIARGLAAGDVSRGLAAALDLGVAELGADRAPHIDDVLVRVGLYELFAVRLEAYAARAGATAERWEELARLATGPLSRPDRALEARLEAAVADPRSRGARRALREHAERTGERDAYVEALIRIVAALGGAPTEADDEAAARLEAAGELSSYATEVLSDPVLAGWASQRAAAAGAEASIRVEEARERAEVQRQAEITRLRGQVDGREREAGRDGRVSALRKLVASYLSSPDDAARAFEALAAVVRAEPGDDASARRLAWLHKRLPAGAGLDDLYESVLRHRIDAGLPQRETVRARERLGALVLSRARADAPGRTPPASAVARALDEVAPACAGTDADAWAASLVLFHASLAGSPREEGRALEALGRLVDAGPRAVLLAAAAEAYRRAGQGSDARRAAEAASASDGGSPRATSAHAAAVAGGDGRDVAIVLERAMGVVVPRAWLCETLARCLESIGEHALAFAWTQRWLALSPVDRRAVGELVRRARVGGDAQRLGVALSWVLSQPDPIDERLPALLDAVEALYALDVKKAGQVARRLLDVTGARDATTRDRLVGIADAHGDAALAVSTIERWVAADAEAPGAALLDIADRRRRAGDPSGAARELVRALDRGAEPARVLEVAQAVEATPRGKGGLGADGVIWLADAVARALARRLGSSARPPVAEPPHPSQVEASDAARRVGALRWDIAGDERGGEELFFAAAELAGLAGLRRYVRDVFSRALPAEAVRCATERAEMLPDERAAARLTLLRTTAVVAKERGADAEALDTAMRALRMDPTCTDAIAVVEACAHHVEGGIDAVEEVYEQLAAVALGIYGRRAAHYRAARQLERLGAPDRAMRHALEAFEAVPNEGQTYLLLDRLTKATGEAEEAVTLLERVADKSRGEERMAWLRRAADLAGAGKGGAARRFEVLLRAAGTALDAGFAAGLAEAVEALDDGGRAAAGPRLEIAARAGLPKLEGPDGARAAAHLSRALVRAGAVPAAFDALACAIDVDGDVEVYTSLEPVLSLFAADVERTAELVAAIEARTQNRHALVGPPLLRLASGLASQIFDGRASADLLAEAERREGPEPATTQSGVASEAGGGFGGDDWSDVQAAVEDVVSEGPAPPTTEAMPPPPMVDAAAVAAPVAPDVSPPPQDDIAALASELAEVTAPDPTSAASRAAARKAEPDGFDALFAEEGPEGLARREEEARERGDHQTVSDILHHRITGSSWDEQVRLLKLRRAAVLEQRLSRPADARRELQEILDRDPDDRSALAFLADLLERDGRPAEAAPLFARLAQNPAVSDEERVDYVRRAVRGLVAAGRHAEALEVGEANPGLVERAQLLGLRLEVARAASSPIEIAAAIDVLTAEVDLSEPERVTLLLEAARALSSAGDDVGALAHARKAARVEPVLAEAVLEATRLEYRTRGMGTPREAQAIIDSLAKISERLAPADVELYAFLIAEALDVIQGGGAGMRELSRRHAEVGPLPLVALGMAERLTRSRSFDTALPLFQRALDGDLRALRHPGRVALAAVDAALAAGRAVEARRFLGEAARHADVAPLLAKRERELGALDPDPVVARRVLESLLADSTGLTRARYLERLAHLSEQTDFDRAVAYYEEALTLARRDRTFAERVRTALLRLLETRSIASLPPGLLDDGSSDPPPSSDAAGRAWLEAPPSAPTATERTAPVSAAEVPTTARSVSPEPTPLPGDATEPTPAVAFPPPPQDEADDALAAFVTEARDSEPGDPPSAPAVLPPTQPSGPPAPGARAPRGPRVDPLGSLAPPARPAFEDAAEERLFRDLLAGWPEAGDDLVRLYADADARSHDVLVVRRHQAALRPGHRATVHALREAAERDGDEHYARAVGQVLALDQGAGAVGPPPLASLRREPELVASILLRDLAIPELEVLSLVWECGMFRRELTAYGLSGAERVALTAGSPLGESYLAIAGHFGVPRALFHRRSADRRAGFVVRSAQPALVLEGDLVDGPELAYRLGYLHVASQPDLVLATSLELVELERLFEAVLAAFGPVKPHDSDAAPLSATFKSEVARLGAELWQRVSPRAERRLRELCEPGELSVDDAIDAARRAARRAGLFASGDLPTAIALAADELSLGPLDLSDPDALESAAARSAALADLVRLATRFEYAEARWLPPPPASIRR